MSNKRKSEMKPLSYLMSSSFSHTHTRTHTHAVRSLNLLFVFQLNFLQHHKPTGRNGRENKNIKQLMSNRKKMPRGKQNKTKKRIKAERL